MNVVFDTGVIVAGIYWRNEPCRCLAAFARRRFQLCVSDSILDEYRRAALELKSEENLTIDPAPALAWIQRKARLVHPVRLGRPACRDPQDDKFLGMRARRPGEMPGQPRPGLAGFGEAVWRSGRHAAPVSLDARAAASLALCIAPELRVISGKEAGAGCQASWPAPRAKLGQFIRC